MSIFANVGFTSESYGDSSINTLTQHYGKHREAQTVDGEECLQKALISILNGKPFKQLFLSTQRKLQLKELVTNAMY